MHKNLEMYMCSKHDSLQLTFLSHRFDNGVHVLNKVQIYSTVMSYTYIGNLDSDLTAIIIINIIYIGNGGNYLGFKTNLLCAKTGNI